MSEVTEGRGFEEVLLVSALKGDGVADLDRAPGSARGCVPMGPLDPAAVSLSVEALRAAFDDEGLMPLRTPVRHLGKGVPEVGFVFVGRCHSARLSRQQRLYNTLVLTSGIVPDRQYPEFQVTSPHPNKEKKMN